MLLNSKVQRAAIEIRIGSLSRSKQIYPLFIVNLFDMNSSFAQFDIYISNIGSSNDSRWASSKLRVISYVEWNVDVLGSLTMIIWAECENIKKSINIQSRPFANASFTDDVQYKYDACGSSSKIVDFNFTTNLYASPLSTDSPSNPNPSSSNGATEIENLHIIDLQLDAENWSENISKKFNWFLTFRVQCLQYYISCVKWAKVSTRVRVD